jgi:hypothetical protein
MDGTEATDDGFPQSLAVGPEDSARGDDIVAVVVGAERERAEQVIEDGH